MAGTPNALSQLIWKRNAGVLDYVPISTGKPEAGGGQKKRFEKVDMGFCCCFQSSDCSKIIFISRDDRLGRFWNWFWGWIAAKKKFVNLSCICTKGKVVLGSARGAWRRLFWKVRSELRKSMRPTTVQKFTYDVYSYSQNFDEGCWKNDQDLYSSAHKFASAAINNGPNGEVVRQHCVGEQEMMQ
ncbi:hypothetical protein SUGI_0845510 [Cryptomeria japonica]|uniref:uncharacterized protein LOC131034969 n=1 Tax=Cryptomeria japonica TaxID=3369 RepID=UPI002414C75F|nr:uncharacterized protein LOC131034969 [Cryptomeria japonica]GLJ40872.1 hypothetical protein SUGI_0845510 [Cryptomeria japonica]